LFKRVFVISLFTIIAKPAFAGVDIPKDWPRMKPGYMEVKMNMNGIQQTMHMCMTKEALEDAERSAAKENDCTIDKANRKGNQFFVDMSCKNHESGKPMKMTSVSTLISENESHSKAVATEAGKIVMNIENKQKRLRSCTKKEEASSRSIDTGAPTGDDVMKEYQDILGGENDEELKEIIKNMQTGE
jgi:hypothetical protein